MARTTYEALDAVSEFHRKANHLVTEDPNESVPWPIATLRIRLIAEETSELITAMMDKNIPVVADSLADLLYVSLGTAVSYGITPDDNWPEGVIPLGAPDDTNIAKEAAALCIYLGDMAKLIVYATIEKCPCGVEHSLKERREGAMLTTVNEFNGVIAAIAEDWGIPLKEIFFEVHRSNMTKNLGRPRTGEKYAVGLDPKGPGYEPPKIADILNKITTSD